jgi:ATP-dependent RNA helicase RhlE
MSPRVEAHFRLIEERQGMRLFREVIAGFEPVEAVAVGSG